jgi:predicted AAA+ superfamily ATPase
MVVWPLSQGEIDAATEDLLPGLRADAEATVARHPASTTSRAQYVERICRGGFPPVLGRAERARGRWFDDYLRNALSRDAVELAQIRQRQLLADLLSRVAGQTAQVLHISELCAGLAADRKTVDAYLRLLEDLFLVARLPAWGKTLHARATGSPKIHVVDSGVAARLMRINPATLASLDPSVLTDFGHLLETFVVGELRKHISWLDEDVTLGHWRTSDGDEVDAVIEFHDGAVVAFEVKAAERVAGRDLTSLRKLRDRLGPRFAAGVALSTGPRSYTYEDRLHVMPIDRLWRPVT